VSATFVFAGGGTGGHLYPGLALARALELAAPRKPRIVFVSSDRPLDAEILGKQGVEFVVSPAAPVGATPRKIAKFVARWGRSVRENRALLRRLRGEAGGDAVHVVAMGGFVAAPAAMAARAERVGVTLVNLDAVPGKANRWISRRAQRVFTTARVRVHTGSAAGWVEVPPIVRREAVNSAPKSACRERLGLDPARPTLMVTGGSQGARSLNDFVSVFAGDAEGRAALAGWQVVHQTGKGHEEAVRLAYASAGVPAVVSAFADDMAAWWGAADAAVARAGAGNVGEVWANKVPTLFLPYPYHRDEHQRFNALTLEEAGGVIIGKDLIDAGKNVEALGPSLAEMLRSEERRRAMRSGLVKLGAADGAVRIAKGLLEAVGAIAR
jgi:UDP-N-acetylglucosamine--N-acetylmuramyl-(pentapeptide) pyrophosphoryl-undecaprenol N-acetylglucosamine transferase